MGSTATLDLLFRGSKMSQCAKYFASKMATWQHVFAVFLFFSLFASLCHLHLHAYSTAQLVASSAVMYASGRKYISLRGETHVRIHDNINQVAFIHTAAVLFPHGSAHTKAEGKIF
jgi:hypothetical protein